MPEKALNILQVSTRDIGGGAEKVAWDLFRTYRTRGHGSRLAVGYKRSGDPDVLHIPNDQAAGFFGGCCWRIHRRLQPYYARRAGARWLCRLAHRLAEPGSMVDDYRGLEDFRYPGTWRLPSLPSATPDVIDCRPDVIHCHNLHGKYFDLRALPSLSRTCPAILTLHDAWLLSGHCAHSLGCERWKAGCGQCPDLGIYPATRCDATDVNWRRKREIYRRSRLYVATPCRWLMQTVEESMLAAGIVESRIIPYGVDLSVFHPADRQTARSVLGIQQDLSVLLFSAVGIRRNPWKDYGTLREAVARIAERRGGRRVLFIALGDEAPAERIGAAEVRFVPYTPASAQVARYYQAADVYVHAARAETFPNAILEALACGTPVVATAVGGIPEQIKPLWSPVAGDAVVSSRSADDDVTGALVPAGDAAAMAEAVARFLDDDRLRHQVGASAAADARKRFDLHREADDYLAWYAELLERRETPLPRPDLTVVREQRALASCSDPM